MERQELDVLNGLLTYAEMQRDGDLTFEERAVIQIVQTWKADGVSIRQVCPHCLSVAPYGDGRHQWLRAHIYSSMHEFYWRVRRTLRCA